MTKTVKSSNKSWKKTFFQIYIGQTFSLLSSSVVQFSIIWWITITTGSPIAITIASVVGLLPQAILGLFAGVWIDRYNRKLIMITADILVATSSLALFILFILGYESIIIVYVTLFLRAIGETFHKPALQAIIPSLVPKAELTKAGGMGQMVNSATNILGPMLGALIMSITTLPFAMLLDVIGAFMAVLTLAGISVPTSKSKSEHPPILKDIKEGFQAFRSNKVLIRLALPMLITTIIFVPIGTFFPIMVQSFFNGTAWHNGLVQTLFGVGMLISAMIIGITGGLKKQFLMIGLSSSILGLCAFIIGFLTSNLFFVFCIVIFIIGCMGMGFSIPFTAYVQKSIDDKHLGKVLSLITSVMSFAAPVSMFIAGPVSEIIGIDNWMKIAGITMIICGLISYLLAKPYEKKETTHEKQAY
ncbi:MFS transporter [Alkaliphilus serpentinus]|nr:MFS transporter [Alkaliphilus serpentinus]